VTVETNKSLFKESQCLILRQFILMCRKVMTDWLWCQCRYLC